MADDRSCGIRCADATIKAAFEAYEARYAKGPVEWDTPSHARIWLHAEKAFAGSFDDFREIYEELRRHWQVFRGGVEHMKAQEAFAAIQRCRPEVRSQCLSSITVTNMQPVWQVIQTVQGLKRTKSGPSTVAVSKFLHFWNPRLFVIVDHGVMWQWVLAHQWLWQPIQQVRDETDKALGCRRKWKGQACDLETYLAILVWAGAFLRAHPQVLTCFVDYLGRSEGPRPAAFCEYEAAAMEWFLLGLVEITPAGWVKTEDPACPPRECSYLPRP